MTYELPPAACVHITNCIVCGPVYTNGTPFAMSFVVYAYSYYSRGGGGKGGGGAGTRWWVTGGSVTVVE